MNCPDCKAYYGNGGHCRGGRYEGCCQSFGSDSVADAHRVGPFNPPGLRRCLTVEEMKAKGWNQDSKGQWRSTPPGNRPKNWKAAK